jgi:effector-binding domain-containing protein
MTTTDATILDTKEVAVPPVVALECNKVCAADPAAIAAAVGAAFRTIEEFRRAHAIAAAGRPRVIYTEWGASGVRFTAAVPIADVPPDVADIADVSIRAIPESRALRFIHRGPYRDIRNAYDRIEGWLRARGGIRTPADWGNYSPMWEEYVNDPATTPEADLITRIYLTLP